MNCGDLYIGNSINVRIVGLKSGSTPINDATCTVTLKGSDESIIAGAENLRLEYVTGSDGEYLGVLPSSLSLVENGRYEVEVTATKGGIGVAFWQCTKVAKKRRCS